MVNEINSFKELAINHKKCITLINKSNTLDISDMYIKNIRKFMNSHKRESVYMSLYTSDFTGLLATYLGLSYSLKNINRNMERFKNDQHLEFVSDICPYIT